MSEKKRYIVLLESETDGQAFLDKKELAAEIAESRNNRWGSKYAAYEINKIWPKPSPSATPAQLEALRRKLVLYRFKK